MANKHYIISFDAGTSWEGGAFVSISDRINVALCILSFLLAVISVITVAITLRQNHRMIENATRPYVTVYGAVTGFDASQFYLVIRNFGQSSALITEFSSSAELSQLVMAEELPIPFEHIVGQTLSPNQAMHFPISHLAVRSLDAPLSFHIRYSSFPKSYDESVTVSTQSFCDLLFVHAGKESDTLRVISNTLQEIAVNQL